MEAENDAGIFHDSSCECLHHVVHVFRRPQQMGKVPTSPHNNAMRSPEVASRGGGRKSPSPMLRTRDSPFFDFSDEDDADDAAANRHRRSARHRVPPRRSHQLKVNQPRTPQARKKRGKSAKLSQARSEEVTQRDSNRQHILSPSGQSMLFRCTLGCSCTFLLGVKRPTVVKISQLCSLRRLCNATRVYNALYVSKKLF